MHTVKLLEHQALLVQSPFVNSDIRFHFLIAGYASGKTSGLVYAILHTVKNLLGKKDEEGHNPKILVASKNLTFMKKTLTGLLEQDLRMTCSEYTYDKAHNIITIGNVELLLIPDEDESSIYGFSCYCFKGDTLVATSEGDKRIDEIKEGDLVLTRKGFKKVTRAWCSGEKDCISVNVEGKKIICTPEHRFIDSFNNEVKAQDLTKTTSLVKIDTKEWRKWLSVNGKIERSLSLLTSTASGTTGIQILNHTEKDAITPVQMRIRGKVIQLCTEICGLLHMDQFQKDMMYTTKMETFLTILLRTLSLLQEVSMQKNTGNYNQRRKEIMLLKLLRMLKRRLLRCGKTQNTGKDVAKKLKKIYKTGISIVDVECVEKYLIHVCQRLYTALKIAKSSIIMLQQEINMQQIKKNVFVKFVEKFSKQTDMQLLKPAHLTAKTSNVVERCKVYDLEVEDAHEFFANGILVHNCSFVDELDELDTQTAMAVVKSINDRTRQQIEGMRSCFIMFTTSSQGLKGTYQTVMHFNKSNIGYVLIRARTKDNIYLPPDYIKNMYSIYNEKERDCLLEGKFVSIDSGLIFPDYDPKNNKLDNDLYDFVRNNPEYPVYIGQDFNCMQGDVLIDTLRGKVKIKNIKKDDYVLTRKGYKKVLHKVCKGIKMVQDFNNGLVGTHDHIAITPQGEVELCKAKQFYCLKEQSTESLKEERKALLKLLKLKKLLLKEGNTTGIHKDVRSADTIFTQVKEHCIEIYTRNILDKYGKEIISTIKTESMITDLKILKKFLLKNTQKNISLKKMVSMLKLQRKDYQNIICQKKVDKNTVRHLKTLGRKENIIVLLFALIVTNSLKQKSELLKDVKNAKRSGIFIEKENAIKVLKELVLFVENTLQEQVQQNIVKNTKIIGKDQIGKERFSKVYDIEVEDAHEFYANNILVHNCFGNNAVAFTVIDNSIIAIKDYEFPDIRRAPEVFRYDFPENRIVWVPDMTYEKHFSEFKKELRIFKIDLALRKCNPLVGDRNFACNKLFVAQRLFICPMCKGLETTLLTWQKDPRTGQPYKGGKGAPDHKGDCLGYVVHYLLSWKKELKYLYRVTLQRLYDARRARGTQATELEIDSHEINWDKLSFIKLKDAPNVVNNGD